MNKVGEQRVLTWFRKSLRLRDNPALAEAIALRPAALYPVFVIDPHFVAPERVGLRRYNFLLERYPHRTSLSFRSVYLTNDNTPALSVCLSVLLKLARLGPVAAAIELALARRAWGSP